MKQEIKSFSHNPVVLKENFPALAQLFAAIVAAEMAQNAMFRAEHVTEKSKENLRRIKQSAESFHKKLLAKENYRPTPQQRSTKPVVREYEETSFYSPARREDADPFDGASSLRDDFDKIWNGV